MIDRSTTPVTIPGDPMLEGIWVGSAGGVAVIAPPHPMMGGHLSNPVVEAIALGVIAARHRALLFNFRGVGESLGDPSSDPEDADEDFRGALAVARARSKPLIAAGYSFGAAAALRAATLDRNIQAVIAVAPPPALIGNVSLEHLGNRVTIIIAERDQFAPPAQGERFAKRSRGGRTRPPEEMMRQLAGAANGARLEVVAGADHFFGTGLDRIATIARAALETVR
jgi:alpha/beta superfamily hydrolase